MACGTYVSLGGTCGHKECLRLLPFKGWCLGLSTSHMRDQTPGRLVVARAKVSSQHGRGLQSPSAGSTGVRIGEAKAAGPGRAFLHGHCCLWLWRPRRSDLLQPSSPCGRENSKETETDGAGPELGDLRLITLTWSPVVLGCGETGAASLVETLSPHLLCLHSQRRPHAPYTQTQVGVTVMREVTGQRGPHRGLRLTDGRPAWKTDKQMVPLTAYPRHATHSPPTSD